jgi:hypothetical protein
MSICKKILIFFQRIQYVTSVILLIRNLAALDVCHRCNKDVITHI